ncbi:uncharacterized protein EI97DRAFT_460041 [Westerdykella ornata]|uniref:Uncharacterized protein n=1 Tax=Westerdykella ornata TaxID=318751 RepID=A0A6A6JGU8_WESOR|nr:uncharacterized protein EI97DRAFT_460041 [Westerdykella ornata]KAF2274449.1 hypothetical protein EI97DRAFT_460041 [Westerdykella ornata]
MGGNNTTTNNTTNIIINNNFAPNPPTPNFIDTLLTWVNDMVSGSPFPITGDLNKDEPTLQTAVQQVAITAFLQKYNYAYNGANTSPPNYNGSKFFGTPEDFTNVAQNVLATNINIYVTNDLFIDDSLIPQWALKKMRNDLATWVQVVAGKPVIKGWQIAPYTRYYNDPSGKENISVDAQTLYTIVDALDQKGNPQKTLFLSFVGVWYGVSATFDLTPPQGTQKELVKQQVVGYGN